MEITKEYFDAKVHETMDDIMDTGKEKDIGGPSSFMVLLPFTLGACILRGKLFGKEKEEKKEGDEEK